VDINTWREFGLRVVALKLSFMVVIAIIKNQNKNGRDFNVEKTISHTFVGVCLGHGHAISCPSGFR
jgi:hypothetical protein